MYSSENNGCAGAGNWLISGSRNGTGWSWASGLPAGWSTRRHLAWLDKEIAQLDKAYQALLQRSDLLRPQATQYRRVPGGGFLDRGHAGGFSAQIGSTGPQDLDYASGTRTLVAGQWPQMRKAVDPGWSGCRAPRRCTWRPCP